MKWLAPSVLGLLSIPAPALAWADQAHFVIRTRLRTRDADA